MIEHSAPSRLRGFTLIELLVSTAILSIMVVMLMQVLNHTSSAWMLGQAQSDRRQSARSVADMIARELQPALMPIDPADQKSLQFLVNPSGLASKYANPDSIFWQAPIAVDRSQGDVAEVGFFLRWDTSVTPPRPALCRLLVNPTDTAHYLILKTPADWLTPNLLDDLAPATQASSYAGLFSENVIGFWVRCFDKTGTVINTQTTPYDSRVKKALPRTVKIYLVLVGPAGLARLTGVPNYATAGSGTEPDLQAFINALPVGVRQTARPFVTEVYLQNAQ